MEFKKIFTYQEAQSALPLVQQIVGDVLTSAKRIRELGEDHEELPDLQAELEENILELESMGCYFKDWSFDIGLVDFPAVIDGQTVFLCWRSDERTLEWYHPVDEGFSSRRRLP